MIEFHASKALLGILQACLDMGCNLYSFRDIFCLSLHPFVGTTRPC